MRCQWSDTTGTKNPPSSVNCEPPLGGADLPHWQPRSAARKALTERVQLRADIVQTRAVIAIAQKLITIIPPE